MPSVTSKGDSKIVPFIKKGNWINNYFSKYCVCVHIHALNPYYKGLIGDLFIKDICFEQGYNKRREM